MDIILLLKTVLLGIVEGITEWLPISSTGHLILADEFIKLNMTADFKEMFDVVIQLGAIMAVVVLYFHKLNPFSPKKNHDEKMDTIILWTKEILAVFPAAIIGILFVLEAGSSLIQIISKKFFSKKIFISFFTEIITLFIWIFNAAL